MYKIDFYDIKNDLVLTKSYTSLEELFKASLTVHSDTLTEVEAFSAIASFYNTILLRTNLDDLILEYNIAAFREVDELYNLLLSSRRFNNEETWIRVPTERELIAFQEKQGREYINIGSGWYSFTTKHFEWNLDDNLPPLDHLRYSSKFAGSVYNISNTTSEVAVAFKLEDFVGVQTTAITYNDCFILLVEYP